MIRANNAINNTVMRLLDNTSNHNTLSAINQRAAKDYSKKMSKVNMMKNKLERQCGIQSML